MATGNRLDRLRDSQAGPGGERVAVTSTVAERRIPAGHATFRDVFAVREFRALWASQILSELGDRLTLVALTLLIYTRTGSPLLSALTYAAGSLPWVMGSLFFSGLGDRLPRRQVMVACDVIRAVLVAAMLVPGIPILALVGLLYLTTMAQSPFEAARSAVLPDLLDSDRYALAATIMQTTFRVALVAGAAIGGAAIVFLGARPALALDAATFVGSAALIRWGTRARPAPAVTSALRPVQQLTDGFRLLLGDKTIRTVMMLGWLIALYSIPEGIAAPYVARLGGGPLAAGLVVASGQAGAVLFAPLFARKVGRRARLRWMGPMAAACCAILLLTAFRPGLVLSMAIFALSGTFAIYQIAANTAFVECVPPERRSQAFGLASMGTVAAQGIALLVAGAAAEFLSPATVIAASGALGAVAATLLALRWRHLSPALARPLAPAIRVPTSVPTPAPSAQPPLLVAQATAPSVELPVLVAQATAPHLDHHEPRLPHPAHQVTASRCRPEPSRPPHPRQLPTAHPAHRHPGGPPALRPVGPPMSYPSGAPAPRAYTPRPASAYTPRPASPPAPRPVGTPAPRPAVAAASHPPGASSYPPVGAPTLHPATPASSRPAAAPTPRPLTALAPRRDHSLDRPARHLTPCDQAPRRHTLPRPTLHLNRPELITHHPSPSP
jgi:MFS family permease